MITCIVILGVVSVIESISVFVLTSMLNGCIREHTKLARAFARTNASADVFIEQEQNKDTKHKSLSTNQKKAMNNG